MSFFAALKVTLIITITSTLLVNVLGIALAVALDKIGRTYDFCKSAFFLPAILSSVVVSFIWSYMMQADGGIINYILGSIGLPAVNFYKSQLSTVLTVSVVISWAALGFYSTVYDATLKTIPDELYEACRVDGAGAFRRFFHVTLPLLTPGITINTILVVTWGLKQYDFVKVMTPNTIRTIAINAVERAFDYNMLGYSSAIALILFFLIVIVSLFQINFMKKHEVEY